MGRIRKRSGLSATQHLPLVARCFTLCQQTRYRATDFFTKSFSEARPLICIHQQFDRDSFDH